MTATTTNYYIVPKYFFVSEYIRRGMYIFDLSCSSPLHLINSRFKTFVFQIYGHLHSVPVIQ